MAKKVHRKDLELAIRRADILEASAIKIDKQLPQPRKKNLSNQFQKVANAYIDEEREVLLVAIKIR